MQVAALLAQKGGGGKTSIALALAVEGASEGRTVVVLDADPQASACRWRDRRTAAPAAAKHRGGKVEVGCSRAVAPRGEPHRVVGETARSRPRR